MDRGIEGGYETKKRRLALAGFSAPMNRGFGSGSPLAAAAVVLLEVRRYWTIAVRVDGRGCYLWSLEVLDFVFSGLLEIGGRMYDIRHTPFVTLSGALVRRLQFVTGVNEISNLKFIITLCDEFVIL